MIGEAAGRLGLRSLARSYVKALWHWAKAGFPVRANEEAERIFTEHCLPCNHIIGGVQCGKCGCCVSPGLPAVRSKVKMATEHCPIGLW